MNFPFTDKILDYLDQFSTSKDQKILRLNMQRQRSVPKETRKISSRRLRSSDYTQFGHFTFLMQFSKVGQGNVQVKSSQDMFTVYTHLGFVRVILLASLQV